MEGTDRRETLNFTALIGLPPEACDGLLPNWRGVEGCLRLNALARPTAGEVVKLAPRDDAPSALALALG